MSELPDKNSETPSIEDRPSRNETDRQLVVAPVYRVYDFGPSIGSTNEDDDRTEDDDLIVRSLIDHAWSGRILKLISNKAKLMESFSWLSTVGGGYSALGEKDARFSARAGALSLGQQLHLADLLGDERLKVMCHLFAALAALQMNNRSFCFAYIWRVIMPLIQAMPYRDPIISNILRHIFFRMHMLDKFVINGRKNKAIEGRHSDQDAQNLRGAE